MSRAAGNGGIKLDDLSIDRNRMRDKVLNVLRMTKDTQDAFGGRLVKKVG